MTSPFVPIPGAWRVNIIGSLFNEVVVNSLGFLENGSDTTPTGERAEDLATMFHFHWKDNILPLLSSSYRFNEVKVYSFEDNVTQGAYAPAALTGGNAATDATTLPGLIAVNVNLLTGLRGRRYRGRTGLAGVLESNVTSNGLVAGNQSAFNLAFEQFRLDVRDDATNAATYGSPPGALAVISETYRIATPVTTTLVKNLVGTRQGRLR